MKKIYYLLSFLVLAITSIFLVRKKTLALTSSKIDLKKYMGTWFEIASFKPLYEAGCVDVRADYSLTEDGTVSVHNSCRLLHKHGPKKEITGTARVVSLKDNSKLKVVFPTLLGDKEGDYWILEVDENYLMALVGTPDLDSLWILSRSPHLDIYSYIKLSEKAKSLGYDITRLKITSQSQRDE